MRPTKTTDRRIVRTREALREALIGLILEKGYDAITVNEITERANVARSTFYAHHSGKESVLLDGVGALRDYLTKAQREAQSKPGSQLAFTHAFFVHVEGHLDLYHAFMGDQGGAVMINAMRQMLARLIRRELTESPDTKNRTVPLEAAVRFATDALMAVLIWWIETKPHLPAAEGERVFRQLVVPALTGNGFGTKV